MGRAEGVFVVLEEFLGSREFHFRKPRVFFGGISLPMDEVLPMGWSSFVTDYLFDFRMFFIINKIRGWSREVLSVDFILMIRR